MILYQVWVSFGGDPLEFCHAFKLRKRANEHRDWHLSQGRDSIIKQIEG